MYGFDYVKTKKRRGKVIIQTSNGDDGDHGRRRQAAPKREQNDHDEQQTRFRGEVQPEAKTRKRQQCHGRAAENPLNGDGQDLRCWAILYQTRATKFVLSG
jgi:hypothetical protein